MATLKDVAREAGLTVGTVSRAINNRGYVSEKTRKRIYEVMKELDYQPNEMARSLATQRSRLIAVIVPHIEHPYFMKLISCLESAAYERKYKLLLFSSKGREEREEECVEMCKSSRVAGVIVCSGSLHMDKFMNLGCPVVTIERSIGGGVIGMESDNYEGGVLATKHLIEQGCKNLLHIAGVESEDMPAQQRHIAFEEVCRKYQVNYQTVYSKWENYHSLNYYQTISDALEKYPEIDGIFASSDVIAAEAIQICRRKQIIVPDQMKVVGFDDTNVAVLTYPSITSIHQPIEEIAQEAVLSILDTTEGKIIATRKMFPVNLIKREST